MSLGGTVSGKAAPDPASPAVEHDDTVARLDEAAHDAESDETGAAGNGRSHLRTHPIHGRPEDQARGPYLT